jgi:hypothetical protein
VTKIEIEDWQITLAAESKFWSHGIDRQQVFAVLNHRWISIRNRAGRAAPFVLVGRNDQGRCIAIPIAPTSHPGIWRPITA